MKSICSRQFTINLSLEITIKCKRSRKKRRNIRLDQRKSIQLLRINIVIVIRHLREMSMNRPERKNFTVLLLTLAGLAVWRGSGLEKLRCRIISLQIQKRFYINRWGNLTVIHTTLKRHDMTYGYCIYFIVHHDRILVPDYG